MLQDKKKAFIEGLIWNYGSVFILALGGFVFSTIIICFYDEVVLGIFNQVYAYYIVLSQISVFGIHMAVLRYVSLYEKEERGKILGSALVAAVIIGVVLSTILVLILESFTQSDVKLIQALKVIPIALVLFSVNKILLNYQNGASDMKAYAVFQALRSILIAAYIVALSIFRIDGTYIGICFALAEISLCILNIIYCIIKKYPPLKVSRYWIKQHLSYGWKILPGNLILEFNTKIDIICLGLVLGDDALVGIYSFGALFAEGLYQFFVVIRRSLNPHISKSHESGELAELINKYKEKYKVKGFWGSLFLAVVVVMSFCFICMILSRRIYLLDAGPLAILCIGIAFNMNSIIWGNILSQVGLPAQESVVNLTAAAVNFIFNIVLIFFFGMYGAAIATSISYFAFAWSLKLFVRRRLNCNL